jgi:hypothetical protein
MRRSTWSSRSNRRPNAVSLELDPAAPTAADVVQCRIETSLVTEDPDYDIVRYRYRWRVGGRVVRTVTSAALSDVVRKEIAQAGQTIECAVTPGDGRLRGPTTGTSAPVR